MKTVYNDPITGIVLKQSTSDWWVRICLLIVAIGGTTTGWVIGKRQQTPTTQYSEHQQDVEQNVSVNIFNSSETNSVISNELTSIFDQINQIKNQFDRALDEVKEDEVKISSIDTVEDAKVSSTQPAQPTSIKTEPVDQNANKLSFEEYDQQMAQIARSTDLKNPQALQSALNQMADISTHYFGQKVHPTTDDVFSKWQYGIIKHTQNHPTFKSAMEQKP